MKWLIASDIHGSALYCRKLLEAYEREYADRLLLLGDILYHGERDIIVTTKKNIVFSRVVAANSVSL